MTNSGYQQQYTRSYHAIQHHSTRSPLLRAECAHGRLVAHSGSVALAGPVVVVYSVAYVYLGQLLPQ